MAAAGIPEGPGHRPPRPGRGRRGRRRPRRPRAHLGRSLIKSAAEDHSTAPIMVAHVVKTAQAAVSGSRALGNAPRAAEPIAAAARFLAGPKRERFAVQSAMDAIATLRGLPEPESDRVRP